MKPPTANVAHCWCPRAACACECVCVWKSFQVTGKKAEHSEFTILELGSKSEAAILEALFAPRPSGRFKWGSFICFQSLRSLLRL